MTLHGLSRYQKDIIIKALKEQALYTMYYNDKGMNPNIKVTGYSKIKFGRRIYYMWEDYLCKDAFNLYMDLK